MQRGVEGREADGGRHEARRVKLLRRTPHLRSSGPKNEEPPIFNLRSSAPKIEEPPPIFDLRPRRSVRRSDGRREVGGDFFEDGGVLRRWGGSSIFRLRRAKNPPIFDLRSRKNEEPPPIFHLLCWKNEEPPPSSSSSDPPPPTNAHQVLPALLESRSPARSSTLKIGPKIEIGPLIQEQ